MLFTHTMVKLSFRAAFCRVLLIVSCLAPGPALAQTILELRVEGAPRYHPMEALLTMRKGDGLDPAEIRRSIQNLYSSGFFSQVEVIREDLSDGVALTFKLTPYSVVRTVRVAGPVRAKPSLVLPGTPWTEDLENSLTLDLDAKLKDRGYLHPDVHMDLSADGVLTANVNAGARWPIGRVEIDGDAADPLLDKLRSWKGRWFQEADLKRSVEGVLRKLRKKYLQAGVKYLGYAEEEGRVVVRLSCGGLRPVIFSWSPELDHKTIRALMKEFRTEGLRQEVLLQKAGAVEEDYRNKGYPRASAAFTLDESEGGIRVNGQFRKGSRFALGEIRFEGLHGIPAEALGALLKPERRKWLSASALQDWREMLQSYLLEHGYLDCTISSPRVAYDAQSGTAGVTYDIREGPQYVPEAVDIEGLPPEVSIPALKAERGQPLAMSRMREDLQNIQALLNGRGYANAQVTLKKEEHHLIYQVVPGEKLVISRFFFRNLFFTRPAVLKKEVPLREGAPLSFQKLLDTQSKLYLTGLFSSVSITPDVDPDRPGEATVVMDVKEDSPRSYSYGIGYDTYDRFRIQLGVSHMNLFGTRRYLGLDLRFSEKDKLWRLTYREPTFFMIPYPIYVTTYGSDEIRPDFSLKRWGTAVELVRSYGTRSRASLIYGYEIQIPFDVPADYPVPREDSDKRVSSIGVSYVNDARDDPLYPTKGHFFSSILRYAFPFYSATTEFLKTDLDFGYYHPAWEGATLVLAFRGGEIYNLRTSDVIPLGERFFLGGRDTIRAYSRDAAGLADQTIIDGKAVGGNTYLLANVELRQKLGPTYGVAFFVDSGQVWADWSSVRLKDVVTGTGIGVFFLSPLGPIRAEYAYKLHAVSWDDRSQWYISLGLPF